ncbi:BTB/POZ domain protein [Quillaja saponaria]|uniref:BTB/POZ domain protein n=1 Tax=Quillaja saponaria TaxID=32244 RepID=A0AAD7KZW4_QUISA|nr:BTB/POZ domain protein [Quillaja saponaria]
MKSSKQKTENNRSINGHTYTLHQRLHHALNLGSRFYDEKIGKWKWQCANIEVQKHVIRSIAAFLDSLSVDTLQHPLVKDSVADMLEALLWILQCKNVAMLHIAANVTVKLVSILPSSVLQTHTLDLVYPLTCLLTSYQAEVAISCATALNLVISKLSTKTEKAVWKILKEAESVISISSNIKDFSGGTMSFEYFQEMGSLLSTILWRWPPSRFPVWNDNKMMKILADIHTKSDFSVKIPVVKLYSSLALCGTGAKILIETGEVFLQRIVQYMGNLHPPDVRIEALKLMQRLLRNQENCLKVMDLCGESLVEAIICGMREIGLQHGKIAKDQICLLEETCRLALITRWAGKHHINFWNQGIQGLLLNLLIEDFHNKPSQNILSLEKQISIVQEGLDGNHLLGLRCYIWDTLGWLAVHCREDFNPCTDESELHLSILITCACLAFVNAIQKWCHICQNDIVDSLKSESASRAVLRMIYSPCNYIATKARFVLSDILKSSGKEYLKSIIKTLECIASLESFGSNKVQLSINLMGLTCYSNFPVYRRCITKSNGMKTLVLLVKRCLSMVNPVERLSTALHLHNTFHERTCCWDFEEDWEGCNSLLLYSLWGLTELLRYSGSVRDNLGIGADEMAYVEAQLVSELQEICSNAYAPGLKWYASYILSYFGFYGFPNKLGKRVGKSFNEKEDADVRLILASGHLLSVHNVILSVRCPSLLPPERKPNKAKAIDGFLPEEPDKFRREIEREVQLSAHVDYEALVKLLEYVYLGFLQAGDELVKKLKVLAKRCKLQFLLQMLYRQSPKWGTPFPGSDLTSALGPTGYSSSDIIMEAKTAKLYDWTCKMCSRSVPHMHAHKVILQSSSDYFQALFHSGMQESHSQIIEVPVSWEAMFKLVHWFYSNKLPNHPSGCIWDNMNTEKKLSELHPYLELCWLAEFWLLEDIQEACWNVIVACLNSSIELCNKILQVAAKFSLWKLVEVVADHMAPSYRQLRDSGELELLDDVLVDLIHSAFVRFSQERGSNRQLRDCDEFEDLDDMPVT